MELVDFLLARIAEDEERARAANSERWRRSPGYPPEHYPVLVNDAGVHRVSGALSVLPHIQDWSPSRVLAECEAKRKIVDELRRIPADGINFTWSERNTAEYVLQYLALPFSEHPDYRQEFNR